MNNKIFNKWTILFVSAICLGGLLYFGHGHFNGNKDDFFWGGLWPEVTGFFFEILVVILILDRWKAREEKKLKITAEKRLREHLGFFLDKIYKELKLLDPASSSLMFPDKFHGDCRAKNESVLNAMISTIEHLPEESDDLKELVVPIRKYCNRHLHFIECLVPIASQLEKDHFKAWVRISFYMGELINDYADRVDYLDQRYSDKTKILNILKNIDRFDKESSAKKIFNGAAD